MRPLPFPSSFQGIVPVALALLTLAFIARLLLGITNMAQIRIGGLGLFGRFTRLFGCLGLRLTLGL